MDLENAISRKARQAKCLKQLMKEQTHEYRLMADWKGRMIPIDKNITKLVEVIWKRGIKTFGSCGEEMLGPIRKFKL